MKDISLFIIGNSFIKKRSTFVQRVLLSIVICQLSFVNFVNGQPENISSSEILHRIKGLKTVASVLYVAAHPDDENTRLISYLEKSKHYQVAYLSLTRGEGGQNLIGDEQGVDLGILRTQELLAARKIDGAEQFFSTAYDFGYSKTPEETMTKWGREKIVEDVINVMNYFQPDIVICRFPTTGEGGHGHHTASAMIAEEAFDSLANLNSFGKIKTIYQPKKLFWNTFNFGSRNTTSEDQLKIDVGGYNALLGKSYGEIAAEARSMHRCQAFGSEKRRGEQFEYFKTLRGEQPKTDLMEGIVTDWSRFNGGEAINKKIDEIVKSYNINDPSASVKELISLRTLVVEIERRNLNSKLISKRLLEIDELILDCAGIYLELTNSSPQIYAGDSIHIKFYAINRSKVKSEFVSVKNIELDTFVFQNLTPQPLTNNVTALQLSHYISNDYHAAVSFPYPVYDEKLGLPYNHSRYENYKKDFPEIIYLPEFRPETEMIINILVEGSPIVVKRQLKYKFIDPSYGEIFQPVVFAPVASLKYEREVYITKSDTIKVDLDFNSEAKTMDFEIRQISSYNKAHPIQSKSPLFMKPAVFSGDQCSDPNYQFCEYSSVIKSYLIPFQDTLTTDYYSSNQIAYDHIPKQVFFTRSKTKIVFDDFKTHAKKIGYVSGAGDKIPEILSQLGYEITLLTEENIGSLDLNVFDAIVTGVRAYNTQKWLDDYNDKFLKYVGDGGNFLVQYNTSNGLVSEIFQPFSLKLSRDRVTEEESKVTILDTTDAMLNYPNKIREQDFEGWVQEYGLYFPVPDDFNYISLFSMNDTGESSNKNSTIYCKFGKGKYVYTGLSFFRELPAGVPGAIKLFINLIEDNWMMPFRNTNEKLPEISPSDARDGKYDGKKGLGKKRKE